MGCRHEQDCSDCGSGVGGLSGLAEYCNRVNSFRRYIAAVAGRRKERDAVRHLQYGAVSPTSRGRCLNPTGHPCSPSNLRDRNVSLGV